jgi:peroxiredoxin
MAILFFRRRTGASGERAMAMLEDIGSAAMVDKGCCTASARVLKAGDHAPDFTLPDHDGRPVSLAARLERGPVVLSFLEGQRSAYVDAQVRALADCSPKIVEHGGSALAISPVYRSRLEETRALRLLHDVGSLVAESYGLCRASDAGEVLVTFVIDQGSTIVMSMIDAGPAGGLVCVNVVGALAALRRIEGRRR